MIYTGLSNHPMVSSHGTHEMITFRIGSPITPQTPQQPKTSALMVPRTTPSPSMMIIMMAFKNQAIMPSDMLVLYSNEIVVSGKVKSLDSQGRFCNSILQVY
jgi:hypothetical protein